MYPGQQYYQNQGYAPPQQSMYPPPGQEQQQQYQYQHQHYEQHTYQQQQQFQHHQTYQPPAHFYQPVTSIPQHMMSPESVPPPPQGWAVRHMTRNAPPVSDFQLSNCQGRKRALFIGINYFNQQAELRGCINDVANLKQFVGAQFGFREQDSITLTDDQQDPNRIPTRSNILAAMSWLVNGAQPNDSTTGDIKEASILADVGSGALAAGLSYLRGDKDAMMRGLMDIGKKVLTRKNVDREKKEKKASEADCIMFSGCKDTQTSADAIEAGNATGALSFAVIAALTEKPQQTYLELLNHIRDILKSKYSQKPQLSASHPVDLDLQFTM
ncbi:Ca(2+)-dependent cysteine protease [Podila humilis]|nr:Ca(2+)-dependent cysteine protease [Podila humilis]